LEGGESDWEKANLTLEEAAAYYGIGKFIKEREYNIKY